MKKKKILFVSCIMALLLLHVAIFFRHNAVEGVSQIELVMQADGTQDIQIFYGKQSRFREGNSQTIQYENAWNMQELVFTVPNSAKWIRLDLGNMPGFFQISSLNMIYGDQSAKFALPENMDGIRGQQIDQYENYSGIVEVQTSGNDAFFVLQLPREELYPFMYQDSTQKDWIWNLAAIIILDSGILVLFLLRKRVLGLPFELIQNRHLILTLAKNDFKTKYAGSYLGIVWAFIQPIVTIMVYWFVFSVGLRSGNVGSYPFVLYLVTGIIPWFFFQDALNGGTNALIEYNYLVKKVVFKISILPIVKIISALFVHGFFVVFALILCSAYGFLPCLQTLQLFYFSVCAFLLALGLVYATSAIVVFFRDLSQIISIFLQVGVWMTPIMWDIDSVLGNHPWVIKMFKLNPVYYIVTGYRDAILGRNLFWENHWKWTLYFWVVTGIVFALGCVIFKRLKPHFADVL